MYGCQQLLLKHSNCDLAVLEYICTESNHLHNQGTYLARQLWFKLRHKIRKATLHRQMKRSPHFRAMHSQAAQQTLSAVWEAFQSHWKLSKAWHEEKLEHKPRTPGYRQSGGLHVVSYPKQALSLKDGKIRVPLGRQVKVWFGLDAFDVPMPSNLNWQAIKELRILPRNGCFYAEFVYERSFPEIVGLDRSKALGIDPGLSNWLTCVDTEGNSFIVDGKHLKSLNQWYNREVKRLKTGKAQGFWSNRLAQMSERRNRQMRDAINKAARRVVNHCLENGIATVVFGWNRGQKNKLNLGCKTNQQFVQIPTARLKERIQQLCEQYGMQFVETEESYTSQASFADNDVLPSYGAKPERWKSSGKRVKRGLYRTAQGWLVNADCNGAANILRKVATMLGLELGGVGRVTLTAPKRFPIWERGDVASARRLASA